MRSFRTMAALCLLGAGLGGSPAFAETRRMAVIVGNNTGGPADKPLHYAEEDSVKVADVLAQLGDVHPEDLFVLKGRGRRELQEAMERVARRAEEFRRNPLDRTVLVFYYSGHSDAEALELGTERVSYAELRSWVASARTDVRVVIVDGCRSGALVQSKGGTRGPPFEIRLTDQIDATGEAMLTSSAADELALESREIRGSYFTHHLVSGLRGAADASGDGRITLSEAYQYAFDRTLAATASAGMRQHPGYDYRLSGKGELVLTEISRPSASLELPEGFERALILLVRRDQVLAELSGGGARRVALGPGEYAVRVWSGTQAYATRVTLAAGDVRRVSWSDLTALSSPEIVGKGTLESHGVEELTPEAQAEYLEKFFSVGDEVAITVSGGGYVQLEKSYDVYRGKYRKEVDEADFYREVGRGDLAESYQARRMAKLGLIGSGLAITSAGLLYGVLRSCGDVSSDGLRGCIKSKVSVGFATGAAGILLITGGILVRPHPVAEDEVRRLADEYNQGLRRRLSAPAAPVPAPGPSQPTLLLTPVVWQDGGGLLLGMTF